MFDLSSLRKGKEHLPPRIVLYGPHGIGKSTFANDAQAVFIPTEDGLAEIDLISGAFPKPETMNDLFGYLDSLLESDHEMPALCIDTLDWMEKIIHDDIVRREQVKSMERACGGYGKAYREALDVWYKVFEKLDRLRNEKKMIIILLAHCKVEEYKNPTGENYDRYLMDLHVSRSINIPGKVMEWADMVLFVNYRMTYDKETGTGSGSGVRELYTEERPPFLAKNRYDLPSEMAFAWHDLYDEL